MSTQKIGGIVLSKTVAEEVYNSDTKELEARGWVSVTIVREGSDELQDVDDIMNCEDETADSFTVFVNEGDPAFKKLTKSSIVTGVRLIMRATSATHKNGFDTLKIDKVGVDDENKYPGFYNAPVYEDIAARQRSKRVLHYM